MRTLFGCLILLAAHTAPVPAQRLRVEGAPPPFAGLLAAAPATLRLEDAGAGERHAVAVLGLLRLGETETAAARLAPDPEQDRDDARWSAIAHLWYWHATADPAPARASLPWLCGALRAPAKAPASFADGALEAHARLCLAELVEIVGQDARAAARWRQRAISDWLAVERETWQPGRRHFRPRPTGGAIRTPEPPDPTVLLPAAAGMLVATGDRLAQHLRHALVPLGKVDDGGDPRARAFCLAAAAQLGDRAFLAEAWRRLPFAEPGAATGFVLDAALFAVVGLRLATGAGIDAGCVRLRPWLPPGCAHLLLTDVLASGARLTIDIAARDGPLMPDETGEPALDGADGPRLRVAVTLSATRDGLPRALLLQGPGAQYFAQLAVGQRLERSLPIAPAEPAATRPY